MDVELIDKFDEWKNGFIWLMTNIYYPKYKKYGLQESEKIMQVTLKYKKLSDIYLEFINVFLIETDKNEHEDLTYIYNIFKEWYKGYFSEKPPPKNKFIDEMVDKKFVIKGESFYGVKINMKPKN